MKKLRIAFLFILLIIIFATTFYFYKEKEMKNFLTSIEEEKINVDKYYIYGNHLNIEGSINKKFSNIKNVKLILKSNLEEIEYDIKYDLKNNSNFYISKYINKGINLEQLNNNKFYILLKFIYKNNDIEYYGLKNNTNYKKTTYYTISNYKKTINFNNIMNIDSKMNNEKEIYDIVIDAGHGGNDPGAINGKYYESHLTLEYTLSLKEKLENLGYKIKLTRDQDKTIDTYGINSRTSIPYESKAKYLFSIHFNSSEKNISYSGIEIYTPNNMDLEFATTLSKKIVNNTNLDYSTNTGFKVKDGVYVRTMNDKDIENLKNEAQKNHFIPYNVTTSTPYLYMLRETGGIITNAFVDGRKDNIKNEYYNSNIAPESYLLELGYINNKNDLNIILKEKDKYTSTIANTIDEHIKNNS